MKYNQLSLQQKRKLAFTLLNDKNKAYIFKPFKFTLDNLNNRKLQIKKKQLKKQGSINSLDDIKLFDNISKLNFNNILENVNDVNCPPIVGKINENVFNLYKKQFGKLTCGLNAVKNFFNLDNDKKNWDLYSALLNATDCKKNGLDILDLLGILNKYYLDKKIHFHMVATPIINNNEKLKDILKYLDNVLKDDYSSIFFYIQNINNLIGHFVVMFKLKGSLICVDTQYTKIIFNVYSYNTSNINEIKKILNDRYIFFNDKKTNKIPIEINVFEISNLPEKHYLSQWGHIRIGFLCNKKMSPHPPGGPKLF